MVGGETVTVIPGSGAFASANAGPWAVTATGYTLGGAHAGNYSLSAQPVVPDATISPRPVQLAGTRAYGHDRGGLLVALRPATAAPQWSGAIATFRAVASRRMHEAIRSRAGKASGGAVFVVVRPKSAPCGVEKAACQRENRSNKG